MTENNTKLTKPQLIIGAIVLVIILFFIFSKNPSTEQTQKLPESNNSATQSQNNPSYREQLAKQLIGENEQPSENEISLRFMVLDFFDKLIKEGYLENTDFDKQQNKITLYLDSDILADRRAETWITGLAIQVAGGLQNQNDFALAIDSDPDTGDVIKFAVTAITVPSAESIANLPKNVGGFPVIETREAMETSVGSEGHAKILDLVINGKIFAHFETGRVFAELNRLGLVGVMTRDGNMLREPSLK
ncbi:MAG: hypothetical protein Athens101426_351 [Parcubacteria group bacterium Athens1014_26]|nr:MAG: hypothetical protein Athens101426_351 [Parcubacteria group bacterium Athens1014_26]